MARTLRQTNLDDAWRREMADIAAAERKGDDDTMVLPGDEMSLSSFWWTEAEGKKVREGKKAQMVDVSARRAAPSHIYTMVTTIIPELSAFPSTSGAQEMIVRNRARCRAHPMSTARRSGRAARKGGAPGRAAGSSRRMMPPARRWHCPATT